jgi:hypothetical protein
MAVVNNTLSEIGDIIVFLQDKYLSGATSLDSFDEDVEGETATRFFEREFRVSRDGINFLEWEELSDLNLQAIDIQEKDNIRIQYRYTRAGDDATGLLTFNWVRVNTTVTIDCSNYYYFRQSIFSYFYDCPEHQDIKEWCISVLRKLYYPGYLPQFMERGLEKNQNREDDDFIDFWASVAWLFSLAVTYGRGFENINNDPRLIEKYLDSKGLYVERDKELSYLQDKMSKTHALIGLRGTSNVSAEIKSLIGYDDICDEFLMTTGKMIWNTTTHSPLYRGIDKGQTVKAYQRNGITLSNYPLINSGNVSVITEDDERIIRITGVADGEKAGIGFADPDVPTETDRGFMVNIDPTMDYELTFLARGDAPFTVGVYGYTASFTVNHPSYLDPLSDTYYAITKQKTAIDDDFYMVRVLLYSYNQASGVEFPEIIENTFGSGGNLKLSPVICKAAFEITLDRTSGDNDPSVDNTIVDVSATNSRIFLIDDFINNYQDIEGDPPLGVTITNVTNTFTGDLLYNGVSLVTPQFVSLQDIADELLVYTDSGTPTEDYDVDITFTVEDNQPIDSAPESILDIKDIRFKLLKREYEVGVVNGVHLTETWMKNRSGRANIEIDDIMRRELLPYGVFNQNNYL